MKFRIFLFFIKYIYIICEDKIQLSSDVFSTNTSLRNTSNKTSLEHNNNNISNSLNYSRTSVHDSYFVDNFTANLPNISSNSQDLFMSVKNVLTNPKNQLINPVNNTSLSNQTTNNTLNTSNSTSNNTSGTNSTTNNTSKTNSTTNNTSGTNSTANNTSGTNSTANNTSGTNSTANNTSKTNSTTNNTSGTNSTANNTSGTNSTANNTSGTNSTTNSTNNTLDKTKWKLKYSVFLFHSALDRTLPKMGNYFLENLKNEPLNKTWDIFNMDMKGVFSNLDNLPQNKTIVKIIADYLVNNYLTDEKSNKTSINNASFITFFKPNYVNFISDILGLIVNSNASQHVIRDFKIEDLKNGAYTPNSILLPTIVTFQKSDIIPYLGLKFRDTGVCQKLEVMKTVMSNNPNFTNYLRNEFMDVIDTWNTTFLSKKMINLFKDHDNNNDQNNYLDTNIMFNLYKGLKQPLLLYEMVEQFFFDVALGKLDDLKEFYINKSVDRIYELRKFLLYELISSSPIHNSILIEPLMDFIITLTNSFTDNSTNCIPCRPITWVNTYIIQADDYVFSALNKFFNFGYYVNNTFFESYKKLPQVNQGYFLTFELWANNNTTDIPYKILLKDSSGLINREFTIQEFSHVLDSFLYTPILNTNERKYYCGNQ